MQRLLRACSTTPLHALPCALVQDEVLAHRLGMVPLNVDPSLLEWRGPEDAASEANTLVLRLRVRCYRDASGAMVHDGGGRAGACGGGGAAAVAVGRPPRCGGRPVWARCQGRSALALAFGFHSCGKSGSSQLPAGSDLRTRAGPGPHAAGLRSARCPLHVSPRSSPRTPVTSDRFEWLPAGSELPDETGCRFTAGSSQEAAFEGRAAPAATDGSILLAKLRPGQVRVCVRACVCVCMFVSRHTCVCAACVCTWASCLWLSPHARAMLPASACPRVCMVPPRAHAGARRSLFPLGSAPYPEGRISAQDHSAALCSLRRPPRPAGVSRAALMPGLPSCLHAA